MPGEDKKKAKALKTLDAAERFFAIEKFDKAAKEFIKAAELYNALKEYKISEQCYFQASKALVRLEKYLSSSNAMRDAANSCILYGDYDKAGQYYDISAKYALKSKKREAEFRSILSAAFAYLCLFVKGQQEKGLAFIKRIKKQVDMQEFSENRLIRLVKGLTLAIINRDDSALKLIEEEFINYKFRDSETILIKDALLMAKTHLLLESFIELDKNEVQNEESLDFYFVIDTSKLHLLEQDTYLNHKFNSIVIKDIGATVSDNLSLIEKPKLPVKLENERTKLFYKVRANFPGDGYVGPLLFTLELDERLYFFSKTPLQKVTVKSPPARLGINLTPMINPIINQSFPMEIKLSNPSDADIVDITVDLEFPKSLRLMRGTTQKKIYQLLKNGDFTWQLTLKPLEPGTHVIKATVSFKDQDGNLIGPNTADLPFEINL